MNMSTPRLHITSTPPGEAPEWVRQQWVGLALPLAQGRSNAMSFLTFGVISGSRRFFPFLIALVTGKLKVEPGYLVESATAIQLLEAANPEAAGWWKQNTPHLIRKRRYFVFQRGVGHVVE